MYEDTHTVRTGKRRRTNWFFPFFDWPPMCGIKIKERQMSARNPYKFINSNFCVSHSSFCDISSITLVSTGGNSSRRIPTFVYRDRTFVYRDRTFVWSIPRFFSQKTRNRWYKSSISVYKSSISVDKSWNAATWISACTH